MPTLLNAVVFLPLAGALLAVLVPRDEVRQHKALALAFSLVTFAASLGLWAGFDPSRAAPEFQFVTRVPWIASAGTPENAAWIVRHDAVEVLRQMVARDVYLVPTVTVFRNYGAPVDGCVDNVRRFHAMGGKVALGNDYGGGPGEFEQPRVAGRVDHSGEEKGVVGTLVQGVKQQVRLRCRR